MAPLWRQAFDAIERPLAAGSESWIQSETFMDLVAVGFRLRHRLGGEIQAANSRWLRAWGLASHSDLVVVMNQVASLEREVRELRLETSPGATRPLIRQASTRKSA
jgi:hypothetical protein